MTTTATASSATEHGRWAQRLTWLVPALATFVPLLLTQPGWIGADTKTYLYLNPIKLLAEAPYAWNSQIGLGTVTHQNIGYLFPMGPFYLLFDLIGAPDWLAQRLWLGTIIFLAGMGVRYLLRTVELGGRRLGIEGILVASLAYMFSPYLLAYAARISVILLPWAALPWLIALTARSLRSGGWWYPSAFALVVLAVGGINATALILIGLGPLLWLVHAVAVEHQTRARDALAVVGRIGVLTLATSIWWIGGLWAEGRFGLPVIRYTETYQAVAGASNAPETLRGLGYWFFYGGDKLGPWIEPSSLYTTNLAMLALTYAIPVVALATAALLRWRYRAYFSLLIVGGVLIAVAGHPWEASPVLGGVFKELTRTNAGLSLRSTPRAVPLVALGTAVMLGAGVTALARQRPRLRLAATTLACLAVYAAMAPLWTGDMVAPHLRRPEDPRTTEARYDYWFDAATWLDARDHSTRVYEMPGTDFASYIWGNTVDPITPGLMDRGYVARELFQWGSPQSAAYLEAIDRRMQEGLIEPTAVAPIARTFAVGDIALRADLKFERFRTPRPKQMWDLLRSAPGLEPPIAFTEPIPNIAGPELPLVDEIELGQPAELVDPPLLSVFGVEEPLTIVRTQPIAAPLLVAGDADGLVGAASAGRLDAMRATFLAASFAEDPDQLAQLLEQQPTLMVTDSNRRRAHRWGALRETTGYTERAGEEPQVYDPSDQRLEVFPGATDADYTLTEHQGGIVSATAYGNPITYTPEDRPAMAFDGDPATAWRVGAIDDPTGERIRIDLDEPIEVGELTLVQPLNNVRNRFITEARLHFDDGSSIDVELGQTSRALPGQTVRFPARTTASVEVEITGDDIGRRPRYDGLSGVGFSEIVIPGIRVDEIVRPPTDLLDAAGAASAGMELTYLFERLRANPLEPVRSDPERTISRLVEVPTARSFSLSGTARLSTLAHDDDLDRLLSIPDARQGGVTATSSAHVQSIRQRAAAAFDGDPLTAWNSIYDKQPGHWLALDLPEPVTFDSLELDVLADFVHSVPTRLRIEADGVEVAIVDLDAVEPVFERGHTAHLTVSTPEITGRSLRFIIDEVEEWTTIDWYTDKPIALPVGIAELSIPGADVSVDDPPELFDSGCRSDLVQLDDVPVPVRVTGTTASAIDADGLEVATCADVDGVLDLDAGRHRLTTTPGEVTGIHLDRLVLDSAGAEPTPAATGSSPATTVLRESRSSYELEIERPEGPFWLTLSQSWNPGWQARIGEVDLGEPIVINGWANGWLIDPGRDGLPADTAIRVTLDWAPQKVIWGGLGASAIAFAVCVALLMFARRRPRQQPPGSDQVPVLVWPGRPAGGLSTAAATVGGLCFGLFSALNVPTTLESLLVALPISAVVFAAWRSPRGRGVLGLASASALLATGAYYFTWQLRFGFPADFVWPQLFERVHTLGLVAVLLLAAEAIRELLMTAGSRTRSGHSIDSALDSAPSCVSEPRPQ